MNKYGKSIGDLVTELEAELQMELDLAEWTAEEIQSMYDTLVGSMYNGIKWEL